MSKPKANTVKGVQSLLKSGVKGNYSAGDGLYLAVNGFGVGSWLYRYQMNGKRQRMGLGSIDAVSLAEAREKAAEQKALIASGIDPKQAREQAKIKSAANAITFDDVAAAYIDAKQHEWKNAKHLYQWKQTLNTYVSPVIGHLPPNDITTDHILQILKPIWHDKTETARRVRNRIEIILDAAKVRGLRSGENVATWRRHLDLLLPKMKKVKRHMPALDWQEVPEFWRELNKSQALAALVLKFQLLTGVRSGEVRGARWSEFDFKTMVWTISASRMKTGEAHRVPITKQMMEILNGIPKTPSGLLFEGQMAGVPVSDTAMIMLLRRMDKKSIENGNNGWRDKYGNVIVPHGFRSTFRDWTADSTNTPNIVAEQALAHKIGNAVEAAYRRGDLLERRRELMEAWSQYVTQPAQDKVIKLRKEA